MSRNDDGIIEDQKRIIQQLVHEQELLSGFFVQNPVLSFIKDENGRYVHVSQSFLDNFRLQKDNVIGKTDFQFLSEEMARHFTENDEQVRITGKPVEVIESAVLPHGTVRSIVHKFPILTASGKRYVGGIAVEIEGRLQAEEALTQTTKELAMARDQALEASNLKSAFVANISHELRTPLSAILGMQQLLLDTTLTKEQREYAEIVLTSAQSLLSIVKDILDLSRIEAGKLELEQVPFNVLFLVQDCARLMSESAKQKMLSFMTHIDQRIPELVIGDSERLRQMLLNLISNSIKFTEQGGITVEATVESENQNAVTIRFAVKDSGIGISQEDQRLLFSPFTQVDNSSTRKYGGTGLGLSICKYLTAMMGGEIGVESVKGQGALFWFHITFPKMVESTHATPPAQAGISAIADAANKHVLLVEDHPVVRQLTARQLYNLGVSVHVVANGKEAIAAAKSFVFDVILMDCQLPEVDGFQATKAIREFEASLGRHTPIIAIAAGAMPSDRQKCLAAGMDDFLSKPIRIQQLSEKISQWLSSDRTCH